MGKPAKIQPRRSSEEEQRHDPGVETPPANPSSESMARRFRYGTVLGVLAGRRRMAGCDYKSMMAIGQVHHFDAVGVEAIIVDQPFRQYQRLGRIVRLDIDLALQA